MSENTIRNHTSDVIANNNDDGKYFQFDLLPENIVQASSGDKLYKCHVCFGMYRHIFSLKRHFIRDHINVKYILPADRHNCLNKAAQDGENDDSEEKMSKNSNATRESASNAEVKDASLKNDVPSLRVTVNVSPTGKVSDRKVENRQEASKGENGKKSSAKKVKLQQKVEHAVEQRSDGIHTSSIANAPTWGVCVLRERRDLNPQPLP